VVSGVVLGAVVGLGFNLTESVGHTAAAHGGVAFFQPFTRQSAGLMAAHAAFTAVIVAGSGVARLIPDLVRWPSGILERVCPGRWRRNPAGSRSHTSEGLRRPGGE
jgi:RsiW-degrading membrane proteinase PrsW (M82 family)